MDNLFCSSMFYAITIIIITWTDYSLGCLDHEHKHVIVED